MKSLEQWVAEYNEKARSLAEGAASLMIDIQNGKDTTATSKRLEDDGRKLLADFAAAIREEALQERRVRYETAALSKALPREALFANNPMGDVAIKNCVEFARRVGDAMMRGLDEPDPLVHVVLCGDCKGVKSVRTATCSCADTKMPTPAATDVVPPEPGSVPRLHLRAAIVDRQGGVRPMEVTVLARNMKNRHVFLAVDEFAGRVKAAYLEAVP